MRKWISSLMLALEGAVMLTSALLLLPPLVALSQNRKSTRTLRAKQRFAAVCTALFAATYLVLLDSLLFRNQLRPALEADFSAYCRANTNLVPLRTVGEMAGYFLGTGNLLALVNLLGNLALLSPMGILLPLAFPSMRKKRVFLPCILLLCLGIETAQLLLRIGKFDADDILLNCLGAAFFHACFAHLGRQLEKYRLLPPQGVRM